jgi:hypothetical protein
MPKQVEMQYSVYKELRRNGKIEAGISSNIALRLGEYLPNRYQYAVAFWNVIGFASIIVGIAVMYFVRWWLGLAIIFLVAPVIFAASKRSAIKHVLAHAEDNEDFFDFLVQKGWIVFRE